MKKIQEDEIWTSESGVMPKYTDLERLKRDLDMVNDNINSLNLTNKEALSVKEFYPMWSADSVQVKKGEKYQYNGKLFEVVQDHTTQANWKPSVQTASLWKVVNEEHAGTLEDPMPYNPPMEIFVDKYYIQNDVKYRCTKGSGMPMSFNLSELVGTYVEIVE